MAATDVAPPPINVPVVNPQNGMPTRALTDFLYRLWQRTGGNDSASDFILKLLTTSNPGSGNSGSGESRTIENTVQFSFPESTQEPAEETVGQLLGLLAAQANRHASEIQQLHQEIDSLRALVDAGRSSHDPGAQEDASTAQVMVAATAHYGRS